MNSVEITSNEPLLNEESRLVLYPIKNTKIFEMYKKQQKCFWTADELDFSRDYKDWEKLNPDEQHFIKYVLGFFVASDGIVNINLLDRFLKRECLLLSYFV